MAYHVGKAQFAKLVQESLADLPQEFSEFLDEVPIEIRDRPTRKQLRSVGLADDELLLGLYVGNDLASRSVSDGIRLPSAIYLFQEDIELVSDSEEQLKEEVRTTVLHEIGHHFGLGEEDLDDLGYG